MLQALDFYYSGVIFMIIGCNSLLELVIFLVCFEFLYLLSCIAPYLFWVSRDLLQTIEKKKRVSLVARIFARWASIVPGPFQHLAATTLPFLSLMITPRPKASSYSNIMASMLTYTSMVGGDSIGAVWAA